MLAIISNVLDKVSKNFNLLCSLVAPVEKFRTGIILLSLPHKTPPHPIPHVEIIKQSIVFALGESASGKKEIRN